MHNADNYTLRDYGRMANETARVRPLVAALKSAIVPGESVVLDVGTSFGFFAFIACQLGAAKVYAIEPDDAIDIAQLCANTNLHKDRIVWLKEISTKLELPEKVDIVIADLHGTLPFYNSNIASMIDVRNRLLKAGGKMISMRDRLMAVPAFAPVEYAAVDSPWQNNEYGLDFSAGRSFIVNDWWRAKSDAVSEENLLSKPQQWAEIDYRKIESTNVDGKLNWTIERNGILQGLYVWFDGETAEGLGYSNAPNLPELVYGRAFFPIEKAVAVNVGDQVTARISVTLIDGKYIYRWDTSIKNADGNSKASFKQSTFKSRPINPKDLKVLTEDNQPALNEEGLVAQLVLKALTESKSLGQTAEIIAEQFPHRFRNKSTALHHVTRLARKFSD